MDKQNKSTEITSKGKTKETIIQFIKFGLVGVSNTVISYIIYAVVFRFSENYILANVISWLLSVLNAYLWQNIFVFKQDEHAQKRVWWKVLLKTYAAYAFTGLFLNNVLLWLWISVIDISKYCGPLIALLADAGLKMTSYQFAGYVGPLLNMVVTIPINFIINKCWAYKQK